MEHYIAYLRAMVGDKKVLLNACSVVIVNQEDKVLLQRRSDNGLWGLPGGLMELDESIEACAIREVKEETNLDVELTRFLGVFSNPNMRWKTTDSARVLAFSFLGRVIGGELRVNDDESLEFAYFGPFELPTIHAPDNLEAINAYYHHQEALIEGKAFL